MISAKIMDKGTSRIAKLRLKTTNIIICFNPNSSLDKCGIDLRLVINGLQKPLKRFVLSDNPS